MQNEIIEKGFHATTEVKIISTKHGVYLHQSFKNY